VIVNVEASVRADHDIDLTALRRYLRGRFGKDRDLSVQPIAGGRSNLTFGIDWGEQRWVLRRPPAGPLPPSAHDVLRECPLLSALEGSAVPVPRLICVCRDASVIGAPFYVMERRPGAVITRENPDDLADATVCRRISEQLVDALAELHSLDVRRIGLASLGRPAGFVHRQLVRRRAQLDSIMERCRVVPELIAVHEWLVAHEPEESGDHALVHGDYGFHNALVSFEPARITAVVDWELATLGDPLSDLGWLSAQWRDAGEVGYGGTQRFDVTQRPGFLTRAEMIDRYEVGTGRRARRHLPFYEALAIWRVAIALEGSYAAWRAGSRANPDLARMEALVPAMGGYALQRALARTA
jgi:aminoglycoside phosphotransferase (APT) family kinase protein